MLEEKLQEILEPEATKTNFCFLKTEANGPLSESLLRARFQCEHHKKMLWHFRQALTAGVPVEAYATARQLSA